MTCPKCLSASISKRKHRTSLGHRTFFCRACRRRFSERTGTPFNDLQFPTDVVLLAVLRRLRYKLGFRDVAPAAAWLRGQPRDHPHLGVSFCADGQ